MIRLIVTRLLPVVAAGLVMLASLSVRADWVENGSKWECTSGTCVMTCDGSTIDCANDTFIATQAADEATVFCTGSTSCQNATFFLATPLKQTVSCAASGTCSGITVNVGVPDTDVITAAVPVGYTQEDFYGPLDFFTLSCSEDSACDNAEVYTYFDILDQNINCTGTTNACNGVVIDANSTHETGDVTLTCTSATSCNSVTFDSASETYACVGDSCGSVSGANGNPPTVDIDGDGVNDNGRADQCPLTDLSDPKYLPSFEDVNNDGCDDVDDDDDGDGINDGVDGDLLEWVGSIYLGDFFNEVNWEDDGYETLADVINPEQVIGRTILVADIVLMTLADGGIYLGEGNSLTLQDGHIRSGYDTYFQPLDTAGGSASIFLKGDSSMTFGYSNDISWNLADESRLRSDRTDYTEVLGGSGTLNFEPGRSYLELTAIPRADSKNLLSQITVDSAAAVLNTNIFVKNELNGSIIKPDFDGDGIGGADDYCPTGIIPVTDFDSDGCDDASEDNDDDNDKVPDSKDKCLSEEFGAELDTDSDGCEDEDDNDDDNDGIKDKNDACLTADLNLSADFDGDGCDDADEDNDDDNDGVKDSKDECLTKDGDLSSDNDKDGCDDADEDKDDDNDFVKDKDDAFPLDPDRWKKSGGGGGGGSLSYLLALLLLVGRKKLYHSKKLS